MKVELVVSLILDEWIKLNIYFCLFGSRDMLKVVFCSGSLLCVLLFQFSPFIVLIPVFTLKDKGRAGYRHPMVPSNWLWFCFPYVPFLLPTSIPLFMFFFPTLLFLLPCFFSTACVLGLPVTHQTLLSLALHPSMGNGHWDTCVNNYV